MRTLTRQTRMLGAEKLLRLRAARNDGAIRRPEKWPPLAPPLAAEPTVTPASPSPTKDAVWSRDSKKNTKPEFGAESLRGTRSHGPSTPAVRNQLRVPRRPAAKGTGEPRAPPGFSCLGLAGGSRH